MPSSVYEPGVHVALIKQAEWMQWAQTGETRFHSAKRHSLMSMSASIPPGRLHKHCSAP